MNYHMKKMVKLLIDVYFLFFFFSSKVVWENPVDCYLDNLENRHSTWVATSSGKKSYNFINLFCDLNSISLAF